MKKLIYSKHLCGLKNADNYLINHLLNGTELTVSKDIFHLVEKFKYPTLSDNHINTNNCNYYHDVIDKMEKLGIVNDSDYDEENIILDKWVNMFNKKIFTWTVNDEIEITYSCRVEEPISKFVEEIIRISKELSYDFKPWKRPIYLFFLSMNEQKKISKKYNFPLKMTGFVDARTIILINYEFFFDKNNKHLFYPTIRHELMHILLAQYRVNVPIWLEEGICEVYSKRFNIAQLNRSLANSNIISFYDLPDKLYSLADYKLKNVSLEDIYNQSASFTYYLMDVTGDDLFWKIIDKDRILQNFNSNVFLYTNKTVKELEEHWKKSLIK